MDEDKCGNGWADEGFQTSDRGDAKAGKSAAVQTGVEGEQDMSANLGVGAHQEVRQDPPRSGVALLPAPCRVAVKRAACDSPNRFTQVPVHRDSGVPEKGIEKGLIPRGKRQQLREHRSGNNQTPAIQSSIQRCLRCGIQTVLRVPKRNQDVVSTAVVNMPRQFS
jgi:hypothetical protein